VKKLDTATAVGLFAAIGCILLGNHLEGGHMSAIIQPTAALIVFGGTLGAVLISFSMEDFMRGVKALALVFGNKSDDPNALIEEIVRYAHLARQEGMMALEGMAENVENPFFKKSLLMVADGIDSKTLTETLELSIGEIDEKGEIPAKVFEAAGGYSPTIGIIGAVLGLIHVMANLADVAKVGEGIAVAFVATIYGVAAANIVFLPAANKLKLKHRQEMIMHEIVLHGVLGIQQGQNRKTIVDRLSVFAHGKHGEKHEADKKKEPVKAAA
jgi:chemotaxis protein MotA